MAESDPTHRDAVDAALREIEMISGSKGQGRQSRPTSARKRRPFRPFRALALMAVALAVPFWVLLLTASLLIRVWSVGPWVALLAGLILTSLVLSVYLYRLARRLGLSAGSWIPRLSLATVAVYCVYGLLFLSPSRFKSDAVAETYTALHPVIRLSLATFVLVDSGIVITDAARVPEDYVGMGLPVNLRSLHYPQEDGFVHAVDLRTRGRSAVRNVVTTLYLRSVGLSVLRHTGTADHLHVYLAG